MPDRLRLTRHARNRLRFWKLTEDDVATVLNGPTETTPSIYGRLNAWKQIGGRWVRITYIEESDKIVVITVTVRRRGPLEA